MTLAPEPVPLDVLARVRAPFAAFGEAAGAEWTDAPTLQPLALLLDLAGEAMRPRLFGVTGEGGEELALRPDFTLPLVRAHIAQAQGGGPKAARWLYEGAAFRVAPAGSGRSSEFLQVGVEAYGGDGDPAEEDARIVGLAWAASVAGGRSDLSVIFGDVALFAGFLRAIGLPEGVRARLARAFAGGRPMAAELARLGAAPAPATDGGGRLARLLTDLPEAEATGVLEELWRLAGIQPVGGRGAAEIVHRLVERAADDAAPRLGADETDLIARYLAVSAAPAAALDQVQSLAEDAGGGLDPLMDAWRRRLLALESAGVPADALTLAPGFVRPFGYYDGVLFEVRSAGLPADAQVAAGGRYDGLVARLGGEPTPAVGCMVRPGRAWADAPLPTGVPR